ncbi:alkaline phosphatase family protein [Luteipulveratus mongoliensis]|uniref:alkaline phosphatase family protein n=1 Tax=Luteipulveratus mongoliensis TaxID=571913 RepID=UPI000B05A1B5|nr:alkaline phosphatase family protein [Luteipulveratus mongoliensis]
MRIPLVAAAGVAAVTVLAAVTSAATGAPADASSTPAAVSAAALPTYDHVVVAMYENKNYDSIIGSSSAPYWNSIAKQGAYMSDSYGVTHPSQPNYIALFSGSTQGVTGDSCPQDFTGKDNLGAQLADAGKTFKAYSEDLPSAGYDGCSSDDYQRKHAPWADFDNVDQSVHVPFSEFPSDYSTLPDVSFVVPNMCSDMHDCSVGTGDSWTKDNLDGYAQWAKTHNSLLILTFDEDNFTSVNKIATVLVGANITPGTYNETINHYNVLRTLEDMYGLPALGNAADKTAISQPWSTASASKTYQVVSGGNAIDVPNSSTATGTQLIQWPAHTGDNQKFAFNANGDGTFSIKNVHSGLCVDVANGSAAVGARIIQWTCTGNANQRWKRVATTGGDKLVSASSGLNLTSGGTSAGTGLTQSTTSQVWTLKPVQ